ncbi:MAG TPA: hypothetical protein VKB87_14165 [Myxococcaceae bacterium]|nr:hypothetical protein [Myxococcaceae bacterium]
MRSFLSVAFGLCLCASAFAADVRIPLPTAEDIVLSIPDNWKAQVRPTTSGMPHAAVIIGPTPDQLMLLISPITPQKPNVPPLTDERVRSIVQGAAASAKSSSVEQELPIVSLGLPGAIGYYFSATDRAPKPGEWKYLTQGSIGLGEVLITFTVLMNGDVETLRQQAIKVLQSIRREPRKSAP